MLCTKPLRIFQVHCAQPPTRAPSMRSSEGFAASSQCQRPVAHGDGYLFPYQIINYAECFINSDDESPLAGSWPSGLSCLHPLTPPSLPVKRYQGTDSSGGTARCLLVNDPSIITHAMTTGHFILSISVTESMPNLSSALQKTELLFVQTRRETLSTSN